MPISWTAELFQSTMDVCGITISARQYDEIAEHMGEGFTAEALKHRFRKIKAQAGAGGKSGSASPRKAGAATTPKTNNKTGASKPSGGNKTPRSSARKRNVQSYAEPVTDEDDADDEDEKTPESPTKKVKQEPKEVEGNDSGTGSYFDQPEQV